MKSSLPRNLQRTLSRYNSAASSAAKITNPSPSCSPSYGVPSPNSRNLPPVRYHLFREPLPYPVGLKLQSDIIDRRLALRDAGKGKGRAEGSGNPGSQDVLLLLEHVPTYTTGRRDNSPNPDTLHPEEKKVQNVGADFFITKRGGQVTYHGPGQLVGYPIFDLNAMELSTRCYVEYMQRLLSEYCQGLGLSGIDAPHKDGHVGVFAGQAEKVASIGIHLRHRITSHGFAINITPEPKAWFDLVTACGLADMRAVSIQDLLQRQQHTLKPSVEDAAMDIRERFGKAYGREMVPLNSGEEVGEEIKEIRGMIKKAEEEAERMNREKGGWRSDPDKI